MTAYTILPLGDFMQRIEIIKYMDVGSFITFGMTVCNNMYPNDEFIPTNRDMVIQRLDEIAACCQTVDLGAVLPLVKDARNKVAGLTLKGTQVALLFRSIEVTFKHELSKIFVGYVAADNARYWQQERPFGDGVYDSFPSARTDVTASGDCYAVELYTACVFHLMRVVEKGLRALARERRIKNIGKTPLEWNDWNRIIRTIESKAQEVAAWKPGLRRDRAMEFYRGSVGELYAFKDAYRNYVMHDRADYDVHQAARVYDKVRDFMQRLAVHLSENQKGTIKWPTK